MNGKQAFIAKGRELQKEAAKEAGKEEETAKEAENQLATLKANPALMEMYKENAEVGAEHLASTLPLLKVHATGKSSKNELENGEEPEDGYFFYKPTKQQFKDVECHIVTISQGYYAKGLQEGQGDKFNQILAGVIVNEGNFMPFMMYFTGLKLSYLWEFGKEASVYTKARPMPIPLFALKVRLTTEKVKTNYGNSWVVKFQILRGENGYPLVVLDQELFKSLRSAVDTAEKTIAQIIESKSNGAEEVTQEPKEEGLLSGTKYEKVEMNENVNPDDVPF